MRDSKINAAISKGAAIARPARSRHLDMPFSPVCDINAAEDGRKSQDLLIEMRRGIGQLRFWQSGGRNLRSAPSRTLHILLTLGRLRLLPTVAVQFFSN